MIKITSNKKYEPGDRVTCILPANSSLEKNREYIVKEFKYDTVYLDDSEDGGDYVNSRQGFNPARFTSAKEIRDGKINKILEKK